jgi:predicted Zn finger-like uncharacterized protein
MIITCPHCQTQYQVTFDAIGATGRKVQCAHCHEAWQQPPLVPDPLPAQQPQPKLDPIAEDTLDEALEEEERTVAAEVARKLEAVRARAKGEDKAADAGKVDPALIRKRQKAFNARQLAMSSQMPLGQARRVARIVGVLMLAGMIALAWFGRVPLVERYPALAGLYKAVGLDINVVGLDFSDIKTLQTLRDGKEVLIVSGQIVGLMAEPSPVPPIVVTLVDPAGAAIYAWSVTPAVRDLMRGERATFETQLVLPPGKASHVRLSFSGAGTTLGVAPVPGSEQPPAPAAAAEHPAETPHDTAEEHH